MSSYPDVSDRSVSQNGSTAYIGQPISRVDGPLKVTGTARYSAEFPLDHLAYAVVVQSTIAKGRIKAIDTSAAEAAPGFLGILTYLNTPKFGELPEYIQPLDPTFAAQSHLPLQDDRIDHQGQHIAVVIADTFERATHAAKLVRVEYEEEPAITTFEAALEQNGATTPHPLSSCLPKAFRPLRDSASDSATFAPHDIIGEGPDYSRGDVEQGFAEAEVVLDLTYTTPVHHHNSMELHSTTAAWQGDRLLVHDSSNAVFGCQNVLATALKIPITNVRVVAPFVGGSFGCKGRVWPHVILAAVAAKQVRRPVKLTLTRQQTFFSNGHRPEMVQYFKVGAKRDGTLTAIQHNTLEETWQHENYAEPTGAMSRMMYACPNFSMQHRVVKINAPKANMMHVPGEGIGSLALESGIDELAYELGLDPIELRLRNYTDVDPTDGRPFTSKHLRECYQAGADAFGWHNRNPQLRSMSDRDGLLIGYGMASAEYPCFYRQPASAKAQIFADGSALIQSGIADVGTGTYTVMTQVAADELSLPIEKVRFELGDTDLPHAPQQVASLGVNSVAPAVKAACIALRSKLIGMAVSHQASPLYGQTEEAIVARDGGLYLRDHLSVGQTYQDILAQGGSEFARLALVDARASAAPNENVMKYSMYSFGAMFAEVRVDEELGEWRVARVVSAIACGRILNPKTARNQLCGGIIWGIGHTLSEGTYTDPQTGRYINTNLLEYQIADHFDIPDIQVIFIDEDDPLVNETGTKSVGEIAQVGVIAAIANAIHHATGKRIRDLPITLDKLL